MSHTKIRMVIMIFTVGLTSCQGPQGPQGLAGSTPPNIIASIYLWNPTENVADVYVHIENIPEIPSIIVNDLPIPIDLSPLGYLQFSRYDFPISPGVNANLTVTYDELNGSSGYAWANIVVPGMFEIILPDTSCYHIPVGDSLAVIWTSSDFAEAYSIDFMFNYRYYDMAGISHLHYLELDTVINDTVITISTLNLFPHITEIDSIASSYGTFGVHSLSNNWQPSDSGNIFGDAVGMFSATVRADWIELHTIY